MPRKSDQPDDPTTLEDRAELFGRVTRRMKRRMRKIDHERRAELIDRKIDGVATAEELAELAAIQRACDDALAELDDAQRRWNRWQARELPPEIFAKLREGGSVDVPKPPT